MANLPLPGNRPYLSLFSNASILCFTHLFLRQNKTMKYSWFFHLVSHDEILNRVFQHLEKFIYFRNILFFILSHLRRERILTCVMNLISFCNKRIAMLPPDRNNLIRAIPCVHDAIPHGITAMAYI